MQNFGETYDNVNENVLVSERLAPKDFQTPIPAPTSCNQVAMAFLEAVSPVLKNFVGIPIAQAIWALLWTLSGLCHCIIATLLIFGSWARVSQMPASSLNGTMILVVAHVLAVATIISFFLYTALFRFCCEFGMSAYVSALAQMKTADKIV